MIRGSCLCGGVRFEIERVRGPFELCHCSRCRKASGSAFVAGLMADDRDFRFTRGRELIGKYDAPILEKPPAYSVWFCRTCGSTLPNPSAGGSVWFIPAGALDDDPQVRPDKHIYVELKAPWETIAGDLPQMTKQQIRAHRAAMRAK